MTASLMPSDRATPNSSSDSLLKTWREFTVIESSVKNVSLLRLNLEISSGHWINRSYQIVRSDQEHQMKFG